jgi:hypothetical protein
LRHPDWNTLDVKRKTKIKLREVYERKKHQLLDRDVNTFNKFVQDLIESATAQDEYLRIYAPGLEYKGTSGDELYIYGSK